MRKFLQSLAILTLLLWGGLFLFFFLSGRIDKFLDPTFRIYALISGIGMILLAAFNFINRNTDVGECCHGDTEGDTCGDGEAHEHSHDSKACDHDHAHDHTHGEKGAHDHGDHEHSKDCGHDEHSHAEHSHAEHSHAEHSHAEHSHAGHTHDEHCHGDHSHDDDGHSHGDHAHAHDHEETTSGLAFSLAVLLIPILIATNVSQDKFSSGYLAKWGKIERQMMQMRIAKDRKAQAATMEVAESTPNPYTREGIEGETPGAADTPPNPDQPTVGVEAEAETEGGENEAWGTFTLDDLKNMVPQSDKGDFLLDVPQIFYTAGDKELMQVMEGIPIETTAQLMEETMSNANGQRLKAFRLFIECCAADARPLSIPVDFGKAPPEYTEMGWYKLFGKLHYAEEDGEIIPLINIERIEEALEPTDGLLY